MERMDFSTNQLGDKGVSAILKPMKGQEKLKAVNFNDNGLTSMVRDVARAYNSLLCGCLFQCPSSCSHRVAGVFPFDA